MEATMWEMIFGRIIVSCKYLQHYSPWALGFNFLSCLSKATPCLPENLTN